MVDHQPPQHAIEAALAAFQSCEPSATSRARVAAARASAPAAAIHALRAQSFKVEASSYGLLIADARFTAALNHSLAIATSPDSTYALAIRIENATAR